MSPPSPSKAPRRFLPRPKWVGRLEVRIGDVVRIHPLVLSLVKALVVVPILALSLAPWAVLPAERPWVSVLIALYCGLDFLEFVVARRGPPLSRWMRAIDRLTDYPLLLLVAWIARDQVSSGPLWTKIGLDIALLVLFLFGRTRDQNRLRTGIGYATLIALLWLGQGWGGRVLTSTAVDYLLWANVAFSATAVAYYLGLLQKRFVADVLSAANLLCGVFSIVFASRGRFEISLLFVILGTAFDGFDGAAARRWGGTRIGVYSDDVADAVNYGIAPGIALFFVLGGVSGIIVGSFYTVFTLARLVFFTLNKEDGDPNYFAGVPSPVGGLIAMSSIVVFRDEPGVLGLMIGIAAAQMVSFSTHYRHVGRAIAKHRHALVGAPIYLVVMLLGLRVWGARGGAAVILLGNMVYGFLPTLLAFGRVVAVHRARRKRLRDAGAPAESEPRSEDAEPSPQDMEKSQMLSSGGS